jgi:hypothetical protein
MFRAPQITFYSEDLARLRAFYLGLGFEQRFQHPPEGPPIHVELTLDGFNLGIADVESARKDHGFRRTSPAGPPSWCCGATTRTRGTPG